MGNLRAALGPATTFLKTLFADYGSRLHRGSSGMQKLQCFLIQGGVSASVGPPNHMRKEGSQHIAQ